MAEVKDPYVRVLEIDAEKNNKVLSELVDEGIFTSTVKGSHAIFREMGKLLGLDMTDTEDDEDYYDSGLDEEDRDDDWN